MASPDRSLRDVSPGQVGLDDHVQELVEAERGMGAQGVLRTWKASDSGRVVLTSDAAGVRISRDNGATPPAQVIVDGTPAGGHLTGTYPNPILTPEILDVIVPPGTICAYGGAVAPLGWLLCNGASLVAASYPKLYAAIGTLYGGGAGTFNLPDLRGRVPLGTSGAHPLGTTGGAESVAGPPHTHPGSHSHGLNSHTHDLNGHAHTLNAHTHGPGLHTHGLNGHTHGPGSHTHDLNHDHGNALAAAGASATTPNGRFTAGGATALPDTHTHPVDLPALGTVASGVPSASDTGVPTAITITAGPTTDNTAAPSTTNTGTATGPTAAASPAATETDPSAPAASFPGNVATMPPFQSVGYIIRAGA